MTEVIWELLLFHCRIRLDSVSVSAARASITEHDVSCQQERGEIDSSTWRTNWRTNCSEFVGNWPAGWGSLQWRSGSGRSSASPPDTLWSSSSALLFSPQNWNPEQINKLIIAQNKYWSQELVRITRAGEPWRADWCEPEVSSVFASDPSAPSRGPAGDYRVSAASRSSELQDNKTKLNWDQTRSTTLHIWRLDPAAPFSSWFWSKLTKMERMSDISALLVEPQQLQLQLQLNQSEKLLKSFNQNNHIN